MKTRLKHSKTRPDASVFRAPFVKPTNQPWPMAPPMSLFSLGHKSPSLFFVSISTTSHDMLPLGLVITAPALFVAWLLFLLVTLSVPIIKSIFLFRITAAAQSSFLSSSAQASADFGVWGYCTSGVDVSIVGVDHDSAGECSKPHLGYTFDSTVAKALNVDGLENSISKSLTAVLALHPVVVVLSFIALVCSLFMYRRGANGTSRLPSLFTFTATLVTAIFATIVTLIDIILVAVVRHKVRDATESHLSLSWGNGPWMALAATILIWIALIASATGVCCGNRATRTSKWRSRGTDPEKPEVVN
ncbi:hypothetical protein MKEN_01193500 [Mycena kentingensis (nom. inval.)]|nr:hypothetical protein MKEN_01193500 [Mycena kentingensis (nom. inval.)]